MARIKAQDRQAGPDTDVAIAMQVMADDDVISVLMAKILEGALT